MLRWGKEQGAGRNDNEIARISNELQNEGHTFVVGQVGRVQSDKVRRPRSNEPCEFEMRAQSLSRRFLMPMQFYFV